MIATAVEDARGAYTFPPGLPGLPIQQTWRFVNDMGRTFMEARRDLGDAFCIDIVGYGKMVVFSDEESVKRVLAARPDEFQHANDIVAFFIGVNSIFLKEGDAHKHARRRTLSAFTGDRMRGYGGVMLEAADRWIDQLQSGQTVSALDGATAMTLEIILRALFGIEPGPEYDELTAASS